MSLTRIKIQNICLFQKPPFAPWVPLWCQVPPLFLVSWEMLVLCEAHCAAKQTSQTYCCRISLFVWNKELGFFSALLLVTIKSTAVTFKVIKIIIIVFKSSASTSSKSLSLSKSPRSLSSKSSSTSSSSKSLSKPSTTLKLNPDHSSRAADNPELWRKHRPH